MQRIPLSEVHPPIEPGTEVVTSSGRRAIVVKQLPRAAGSIRSDAQEREFDRTPYSVRYSNGFYGLVLGGEIR